MLLSVWGVTHVWLDICQLKSCCFCYEHTGCCTPLCHIMLSVIILHMEFHQLFSFRDSFVESGGIDYHYLNGKNQTGTTTSACTYWLIVLTLWCWDRMTDNTVSVATCLRECLRLNGPRALSWCCYLVSFKPILSGHHVAKGHLDKSVNQKVLFFARSWWVKQ